MGNCNFFLSIKLSRKNKDYLCSPAEYFLSLPRGSVFKFPVRRASFSHVSSVDQVKLFSPPIFFFFRNSKLPLFMLSDQSQKLGDTQSSRHNFLFIFLLHMLTVARLRECVCVWSPPHHSCWQKKFFLPRAINLRNVKLELIKRPDTRGIILRKGGSQGEIAGDREIKRK